MPLMPGKSRKAFSKNVATELKAGKPMDQSLAISYSVKRKKKASGGKPNKLEMEDRVLMALEYMREYRTYFHIGASYGISESSAYRNIKWIEDSLIKHPDFSLPGKKALLKDTDYELVLIDATETPCERPKKSRNITIPVRKKNIH